MNLAGRTALVTGGAHRLGRGIALALANEGANIVIHHHSSTEAVEHATEEIRKLGVNAWKIQADLADPREIERLMSAIAETPGELDVLVNSAASFIKQPFDEISVEDWDRVMAVNLRAPFLCMRYGTTLLREAAKRSGQSSLVVNIADLSALNPWRGFAHHGTSKGALLHLTRAAARELAPEIRVNAILPGAILPPPSVEETSPKWQQVAREIPLNRLGTAEQVGDTVVFLARNDFVTGAEIVVDGGEQLAPRRGR